MLSCVDLTMRFGGKVLFKSVNLQLDPGRRFGLVGANGSGKSTLIRLLTSEMSPDGGEIFRPNQYKIGVLEQNYLHYDNTEILSIVLRGRDKLWEAIQKKSDLLSKSVFTDEECKAFEKIERAFEKNGGYAAKGEAAKLLEGLGIREGFHTQKLQVLSGGFKLRVMLARLLFSEPDILLLDEPTNHLDLPSIKWLEGYLRQFSGILLISSHDRVFLNAICTDIIDLDHQTLTLFKGNYDDFEKNKQLLQEKRDSELRNQGKKRDHLQGFIDKFRAKSSKARQAQSKMHLVKKLEKEMSGLDLPPSSRRFLNICFKPYRQSGAIVLKAFGLGKSFGTKRVLKEVEFSVERHERICFVGPNGIGKSTLLNILTDQILGDEGSYEWGLAVKYAHFPQDHKKEVFGDFTVLEWMTYAHPKIAEQRLREALAAVLFSKDDVDKSIEVLSGGETARLILAKMTLEEHNVLIFDEPTNHLDMESIESLIKALKNYSGTLLIVSHNRYFMSQIATRIIEIQPDGIFDFKGSFDEYVSQSESDILLLQITEDALKNPQKRSYQEHKESRKEGARLKRLIASCEKRCDNLEKEIQAINDQLSGENFYQRVEMKEMECLLREKKRLEDNLSRTIEEWENYFDQMEKCGQ